LQVESRTQPHQPPTHAPFRQLHSQQCAARTLRSSDQPNADHQQKQLLDLSQSVAIILPQNLQSPALALKVPADSDDDLHLPALLQPQQSHLASCCFEAQHFKACTAFAHYQQLPATQQMLLYVELRPLQSPAAAKPKTNQLYLRTANASDSVDRSEQTPILLQGSC
jgi:hypothetical protein